MTAIRDWNGGTITEPGVYRGIPLDVYHTRTDLLDGPSVSKSVLKWILPTHAGSPKQFWARWQHNPDRIAPAHSDALDFGKAAHCLLLGDEAFDEHYVIRPEKYPDYRTKESREWRDAVIASGRTVVTLDQIERIRAIHADAANHHLVRQGMLNGDVELSMLYRDDETGLWVRVRPDAMPSADGVFVDLKTTSSFDEDFLQRQFYDAGYYLQASATRCACRALGLPFETFAFLYVLTAEVPDTAHAEVRPEALDVGERALRWALRRIRRCLDAGEWPGAQPFSGGERFISFASYAEQRLLRFLDEADADLSLQPEEAA